MAKMLKKDKRTISAYLTAGAHMRLLKRIAVEAHTSISALLSSQDQARFDQIHKIIDVLCSRAEDNMFRDHPQLPNEYIDVFYGDVFTEPTTEVDKEVLDIVKKELAKWNGNEM